MSSEVVLASSGELVSTRDVDDWVAVLGPVGDLAAKLCQTPFVPEALRGNAAGCAAVILTGREMNIGPMLALREIHLIKGKPGQSAQLMRALVLRAGHEFEITDSTDTRATARGRRSGQNEWQTATFTADQAKRAKIDLGGYPEDKLVARVTTRLCRRMFSDVVAGLPTVDELEDGYELTSDSETSGPAAATPPAAPARRTAQRKGRGVTTATRTQAAAAPRAETPEPDLDDDVEDAETVDETTGEATEPAAETSSWSDGDEPALDEPAADQDGEDRPDPDGPPSAEQSTALHAALNGIGYKGGREQKLDLLSVLVERPLSSSTDLTRRETGGLLDLIAFFARQDDPLAALRASYDEAKARQAS